MYDNIYRRLLSLSLSHSHFRQLVFHQSSVIPEAVVLVADILWSRIASAYFLALRALTSIETWTTNVRSPENTSSPQSDLKYLQHLKCLKNLKCLNIFEVSGIFESYLLVPRRSLCSTVLFPEVSGCCWSSCASSSANRCCHDFTRCRGLRRLRAACAVPRSIRCATYRHG